MNEEKTCAKCANVFKHTNSDGSIQLSCETYGWGVPVNCTPPYDKPCKFFSETEKHDDSIFFDIITTIQDGMDDD